ncbi:hypothetical protein, partial [Priestia megaterium]|uniref:hypothetical protein n=1 Tax=Priestia megaterium TaxID=1404 RepID=UPI002E25052D|nr:hypothetical protein [Priestia megaterium]
KVGDSTAPVLTSVEVSPQEVKVGDTVEVRVKATDDISGVQSVSVAYYTPSKNRTVHFQMRYDNQHDIWVGSYVIKETDEAGIWSLRYIYPEDKVGNNQFYRTSDSEILSPSLTEIKVVNDKVGDSTA